MYIVEQSKDFSGNAFLTSCVILRNCSLSHVFIFKSSGLLADSS